MWSHLEAGNAQVSSMRSASRVNDETLAVLASTSLRRNSDASNATCIGFDGPLFTSGSEMRTCNFAEHAQYLVGHSWKPYPQYATVTVTTDGWLRHAPL